MCLCVRSLYVLDYIPCSVDMRLTVLSVFAHSQHVRAWHFFDSVDLTLTVLSVFARSQLKRSCHQEQLVRAWKFSMLGWSEPDCVRVCSRYVLDNFLCLVDLRLTVLRVFARSQVVRAWHFFGLVDLRLTMSHVFACSQQACNEG